MLIKAEHITKRFPLKKTKIIEEKKWFTAVDDISLELERGKTIGIVGESGSGKSTLCSVIGDLVRPDEGRILYNGRDIRTMHGEEYLDYRRNVQFIFQDPKESMNPYYTIGKILSEPLELLNPELTRDERTMLIDEMLDEVGIDRDAKDRHPGMMSGGQLQRIAIARALLLRPKLVICDECVSSLDVSLEAQILNLLMELQKSHELSFLFISHDIGVVRWISDYMIVMKDGKVVEEGDAETLTENPQHPYTKMLIESSIERLRK